MNFEKNRIWIGLVVLLGLGGAAGYAMYQNRGDSPVASDGSFALPDLARADIHSVEITRPGEAPTRLTKDGESWKVSAPLEARADQNAVTTAIDKLDEMRATRIASSNASSHASMEVDSEHGVRVVAKNAGGETLADVWVGAFGANSTMVRVEGDDRVYAVPGSIKFAFNKELSGWRDKSMLSVEADDVVEARWSGPRGNFHLARPAVAPDNAAAADGENGASNEAEASSPALGDWQMREVSYTPETADGGVAARPATTIENFAHSRVRSAVQSLAHMRASDFAAPEIDRAAAGLTETSPRLVLTLRDGHTETLILGNEANAEQHTYYAVHEGDPTIFVISKFLAERIEPKADTFAQAPAPPAGEAPPPSGDAPGMPGGGQLPPEIMEQLQRQLQQQQH